MQEVFYIVILMIILMLSLGFANRVWISGSSLWFTIFAFFTWPMAVGDAIALLYVSEDGIEIEEV